MLQGLNILPMDVTGASEAELDAVVSQATVVLSASGPFTLVGGPLVAACVRCRTHYCDTTGIFRLALQH